MQIYFHVLYTLKLSLLLLIETSRKLTQHTLFSIILF